MKVYIVLGTTSDGYGYTVFSHVEAVFSTLELAQEFVANYGNLVIVECQLDFVKES